MATSSDRVGLGACAVLFWWALAWICFSISGSVIGQPRALSCVSMFSASAKFVLAALRLAYTIGGFRLSLRAIL